MTFFRLFQMPEEKPHESTSARRVNQAVRRRRPGQRDTLGPVGVPGRWWGVGTHGLRAERKGGKLIDAYYICIKCKDAFFNHHKTAMLAAGRWEPAAQSESDDYRSYHLPSYYSPVGMLSWKRIIEKLDKELNK